MVWAFEERRVTVWGAQDLSADESMTGVRGSPTIISGLEEARVRERRKEFLQGTPEEMARDLLARLSQTA